MSISNTDINALQAAINQYQAAVRQRDDEERAQREEARFWREVIGIFFIRSLVSAVVIGLVYTMYTINWDAVGEVIGAVGDDLITGIVGLLVLFGGIFLFSLGSW